jgi:hypothetical protein
MKILIGNELMSTCPNSQQISAYHDGELDAAARQEVGRHLSQCAACARELEDFGAMSGIFASAARPRLSQMSLYRIHNKADSVMDEGLVRTARMLSAIAACVLVTASAALMLRGSQPAQNREELSTTAPPWVDIAVPSDRPSTVANSTPAAAWYLANIRNSTDEAP